MPENFKEGIIEWSSMHGELRIPTQFKNPSKGTIEKELIIQYSYSGKRIIKVWFFDYSKRLEEKVSSNPSDIVLN